MIYLYSAWPWGTKVVRLQRLRGKTKAERPGMLRLDPGSLSAMLPSGLPDFWSGSWSPTGWEVEWVHLPVLASENAGQKQGWGDPFMLGPMSWSRRSDDNLCAWSSSWSSTQRTMVAHERAWSFPKLWVSPNHPSHDHFSSATHGFRVPKPYTTNDLKIHLWIFHKFWLLDSRLYGQR